MKFVETRRKRILVKIPFSRGIQYIAVGGRNNVNLLFKKKLFIQITIITLYVECRGGNMLMLVGR